MLGASSDIPRFCQMTVVTSISWPHERSTRHRHIQALLRACSSQAPRYGSRCSEARGFNRKCVGAATLPPRKTRTPPGSWAPGPIWPGLLLPSRPALVAHCRPRARAHLPRGASSCAASASARATTRCSGSRTPGKAEGTGPGWWQPETAVCKLTCLESPRVISSPRAARPPPPVPRCGLTRKSSFAAPRADPEGLVPGHDACPRVVPSLPAPEHPGRAAVPSGTRTHAHFRWARWAGPASRGPGRTGRGLALGTSPAPRPLLPAPLLPTPSPRPPNPSSPVMRFS